MGPGPGFLWGWNGWLPFLHAPAVVAPLPHRPDHLPEVLADVADPEPSRLGIEAHPPGVAEPERPDLGPRPGVVDERVVLGDRVIPARVGMIDVEPHDDREQVVDPLPGVVDVGAARAVAGADVEVAVGPDDRLAAVVPARGPLDDDPLRARQDLSRVFERWSGIARPGSSACPACPRRAWG